MLSAEIDELIIQAQTQAKYSSKNLGHFGLGFTSYSHFTSPIRRYPDVITHRLLNRYLEDKTIPKLDKLESRCVHLSEREKKDGRNVRLLRAKAG